MQLMQSSTGNPLLDMYTGQYAAMGSMGYHHPSTAAAVTQPAVLPASQSLAIDAGQANAAVAGMKSQCNPWSVTFNTNKYLDTVQDDTLSW